MIRVKFDIGDKKLVSLPLPIPSKKNNEAIHKIGKRRFISASREYKKWERDTIYQLSELKFLPIKPLERVDKIIYRFYPPNLRRFDLTNKVESINDMFVKGGVLSDDNWKVIGTQILTTIEVDKENPRCDVFIKIIDKNT